MSFSMTSGGGDMDVCLWLTLKLNKDWSSTELASLITTDTVTEIVKNFDRLDSPIKMRTLLAFLSMKDTTSLTEQLHKLLNKAEQDSDEWVRVGAGLARRWLFSTEALEEKDDFLHQKIQTTIASLLPKGEESPAQAHQQDGNDLVSLECPYLCKELQPNFKLGHNIHFSVREEKNQEDTIHDERPSSIMKSHRPLITRPVLDSSSSRSSRTSSMTHRKSIASQSRYKRPRHRISVLDIDEVKQIESEKAQKAEEWKRKAAATTAAPISTTPSSPAAATTSVTSPTNASTVENTNSSNGHAIQESRPDVGHHESMQGQQHSHVEPPVMSLSSYHREPNQHHMMRNMDMSGLSGQHVLLQQHHSTMPDQYPGQQPQLPHQLQQFNNPNINPHHLNFNPQYNPNGNPQTNSHPHTNPNTNPQYQQFNSHLNQQAQQQAQLNPNNPNITGNPNTFGFGAPPSYWN